MLGPASQSSLDEADTILRGDPDEKLGHQIAPLGDLDADGLADFGVAASSMGQRAYLVLDAPLGTEHPSETGVTVYRDQDGDSMHGSLLIHALGDLNGDGYEDVGFTEQSYYSLVMYGPQPLDSGHPAPQGRHNRALLRPQPLDSSHPAPQGRHYRALRGPQPLDPRPLRPRVDTIERFSAPSRPIPATLRPRGGRNERCRAPRRSIPATLRPRGGTIERCWPGEALHGPGP